MVQGHSKGMQKAKSSAVRHAAKAASQPKKGHRYIAPKKAAAVKSAALHKVCFFLNYSRINKRFLLCRCSPYIGVERKNPQEHRGSSGVRCFFRKTDDHEERRVRSVRSRFVWCGVRALKQFVSTERAKKKKRRQRRSDLRIASDRFESLCHSSVSRV